MSNLELIVAATTLLLEAERAGIRRDETLPVFIEAVALSICAIMFKRSDEDLREAVQNVEKTLEERISYNREGMKKIHV